MVVEVSLYTWETNGELRFVSDLATLEMLEIPMQRDELIIANKTYIVCGRCWTEKLESVELKVIDPTETTTFKTFN